MNAGTGEGETTPRQGLLISQFHASGEALGNTPLNELPFGLPGETSDGYQ